MSWTRRDLLALVAGGAFACRAGASSEPAGTPIAGVVGVAELPDGRGEPVERAVARSSLATAVVAATGAGSAPAGLRRLFRPDDTVGIKVNCLAGPRLSPRPVVVEALVDLLAESGVPRSRIIVFERSSRELGRAGYGLVRTGDGHRCYGVDNDWDREPTVSGAIGSCYARLVTETCTALVSFGVVKDHDLAGVSAGLKNWYGVIHNPNKYHDNNCDPYVADVVRHSHLRGKLRLTVLDGGTGQYHGGPALNPDALFPLRRLAVSCDPVAADAWAWREIDKARVEHGLPTLEVAGRPPRFLATAAGYGLGVGDPGALKVVGA